MKKYRLHIFAMLIVLVCLASGMVLAQDATVEPTAPTLPADMENALVPCAAGVTGPCDLIAAKPEDIVGVWKQYLGGPRFNAPGGMAYIRYNADGTYVIADSIANTAQPYGSYPSGTYQFEGFSRTFRAKRGDELGKR